MGYGSRGLKLAGLFLFLSNWSLGWTSPATAEMLTCFQRRPYLELQIKRSPEADYSVSLVNPEGINGLPLYQGVVTSAMLPFLKVQMQDLSDWPPFVHLQWKRAQCQSADRLPWIFECGGVPQTLQPWPYRSSTFFAYRSTRNAPAGNSENIDLSWEVTAGTTTYFLGFRFTPDLCVEN